MYCLLGSVRSAKLFAAVTGLQKIRTSKISMWKPRPLVLCGPSGSGKSTLLKEMLNEFKDSFGFSVSHTTRLPRAGEINGKDYHFVDRAEMEKAIANNEFVESTDNFGNLYGTSKKAVEDVLQLGKICVLDIDVKGVINIKKSDLNPKYVFIKPPSMEILEQRLRSRGTETEESFQRRFNTAKKEMEYGNDPENFDVIIINDTIEKAYEELRSFIVDDIEKLRKAHENQE